MLALEERDGTEDVVTGIVPGRADESFARSQQIFCGDGGAVVHGSVWLLATAFDGGFGCGDGGSMMMGSGDNNLGNRNLQS